MVAVLSLPDLNSVLVSLSPVPLAILPEGVPLILEGLSPVSVLVVRESRRSTVEVAELPLLTGARGATLLLVDPLLSLLKLPRIPL